MGLNPFESVADALNSVNPFTAPAAIFNSHDKSDENRDSDRNRATEGENAWKDDRQIIQNEGNQLFSQYNNPAPPAIKTKEPFETWSHEEIWKALNGDGSSHNGVDQTQINAGADGWRKLTQQAQNAFQVFRDGVEADIKDKWAGRAANAAMESTRAYTTDSEKLHVSFQQVANGIDLIQGYLDQAKLSVAPPIETNAIDEFLGHIPGNGVLKLGKHRANEAEARAQEVMKTYALGADQVDQQTPILPEPVSTASPDKPNDPGNNNQNNNNSNNNNSNNNSTNPSNTQTPTTEVPGTEDPSAEDPADTENPGTPEDTTTDPSSTDPASSAPTTPSSYLQDPVGKPNSNIPSTPGSPTTPGGPGPGPGVPGPGSTPSPGKSVPGAGTTNTPGSGGNRMGAAAAAGRAGMPGMGGMGAGAGRGKGEDDEEHKIPDYLVQDRTTELLGEQPRVLPPGGVIGG
ncbi:hypothetical protein IU487_08485 [Nocardia puris]|uniref:hypothetical protein n=1 Tax=Nocardia puris TaxID=208602 RepID=UPI001894B925|nr:hypothetical protein [Nocardia puris]MBF6211085.1 hypothetical protein [Nocardia puris]